MQLQGERVLPVDIQHTLFRIAQEALANAARHSQAHVVDIQLVFTTDAVSLKIHDDGRGFDAQQQRTGVGTQSMRERALALPAGVFTLQSAPGQGTQVVVHCAA
jgi:signal transduction histidine kinase